MSSLILSFDHVLPTKAATLKQNSLNYLARTVIKLNQTHKNLTFECFKPFHNQFLEFFFWGENKNTPNYLYPRA